eukprot:scaffold1236_cov503-Prasinococcus_capsulatus_cf.AAC.6
MLRSMRTLLRLCDWLVLKRRSGLDTMTFLSKSTAHSVEVKVSAGWRTFAATEMLVRYRLLRGICETTGARLSLIIIPTAFIAFLVVSRILRRALQGTSSLRITGSQAQSLLHAIFLVALLLWRSLALVHFQYGEDKAVESSEHLRGHNEGGECFCVQPGDLTGKQNSNALLHGDQIPSFQVDSGVGVNTAVLSWRCRLSKVAQQGGLLLQRAHAGAALEVRDQQEGASHQQQRRHAYVDSGPHTCRRLDRRGRARSQPIPSRRSPGESEHSVPQGTVLYAKPPQVRDELLPSGRLPCDAAARKRARARRRHAVPLLYHRYCCSLCLQPTNFTHNCYLKLTRRGSRPAGRPVLRNSHGTQQPGRHAAPRLSKEGAAGRVGQRLAAPAEPAGGLGSEPGRLLCSSPSDRAGPSPVGRAGRSQARPVEPPRPPGGWRGGR